MSGPGTVDLWIEWDARKCVATLRHGGVTLAHERDLDRWTEALLDELQRVYELAGGRFVLLVDMSGFVLKPVCVHGFAKIIEKWVRGHYTSVHARFAGTRGSRKTVAVAARKVEMSANIYVTREDALAAVRAELGLADE